MFPPAVHEFPVSPSSCGRTLAIICLYLCHPSGCESRPRDFSFALPRRLVMLSILQVLIGHWYTFSGKMSAWIFAHVKIGLCASLLSCKIALYILFIYLEGKRGREKERERNINVRLSLVCPPTGDLACNPGMYPDWESNW